MSIVKLPLLNGGVTIVDSDIAEILPKCNLCEHKDNGYINFSQSGKRYSLHRFVMNAPRDKCVDHKNGDKKDNRRENLRICTNSENCLNTRRYTKKTISDYHHVHFRKDRRTWMVRLMINKVYRYFGFFKSRHIAGIFADQVRSLIVGPFVIKNFSEKISCSELAGFLDNTSGRIFRIVFSRRSDGRQREMVCRTGVNSRHNGGTIPFDPRSMNLFSVYDVQKQSYRFIPLENVICIRFAKTNYRVVA